MAMTQVKKDCLHCRFYYITWNTQTPHGCRAYQFQSKQMPIMVVASSTTEGCVAFEAKPSSNQKSLKDAGLNLNDPKNW
jgi:hypothetical protein